MIFWRLNKFIGNKDLVRIGSSGEIEILSGSITSYGQKIEEHNLWYFIGQWATDWNEDHIKRSFLDYFSQLSISSNPYEHALERVVRVIPCMVTEAMNWLLIAHFTESEIFCAVKDMSPTKSPGRNGFPTLFYQKYSRMVEPKIFTSRMRFLIRGKTSLTRMQQT